MKKKIAVIGGGISGLTVARLLQEKFQVTVFEREPTPGGLIKCKRVSGNLYHMVGGHVFNSKRQDVLDYFWGIFDRDQEFRKATRNAAIFLGKPIGYPIENHLHQLGRVVVDSVVTELLEIQKQDSPEPDNFAEFLKRRFGETLYDMYFKPYNEKIWQQDLHKVPIGWLDGKLPMPTPAQILANNICNAQETEMVHSSFYYPNKGGSQFLVDKMAEGIDLCCDFTVTSLTHVSESDSWIINGELEFNQIVFAGNIKSLNGLVKGSVNIDSFSESIEKLAAHGTTTVLCEIDSNPYSWIYLPDPKLKAHRLINTGNFSETNNREGVHSATVEFTDEVDKKEITYCLTQMPFHPQYVDHHFTRYTYPIQKKDTREIIGKIRSALEPKNMFLCGRFAEWEYYNMDAAIGAAMDLASKILSPEY